MPVSHLVRGLSGPALLTRGLTLQVDPQAQRQLATLPKAFTPTLLTRGLGGPTLLTRGMLQVVVPVPVVGPQTTPLPQLRMYCRPDDLFALTGDAARAVPIASLIRNIQLATSLVENYTRRVLSAQTYTEEQPLVVDNRGAMVVRVRQWPITAVTALSYTLFPNQYTPWPYIPQVGAATPLDPTKADFVRPPSRFLYYYQNPFYGSRPRGNVSVTYTAGYAPLPQDIVLATALVTLELLQRRINAYGANSIAVSAPSSNNSLSWSNPSQNMATARDLLEQYIALEE